MKHSPEARSPEWRQSHTNGNGNAPSTNDIEGIKKTLEVIRERVEVLAPSRA